MPQWMGVNCHGDPMSGGGGVKGTAGQFDHAERHNWLTPGLPFVYSFVRIGQQLMIVFVCVYVCVCV